MLPARNCAAGAGQKQTAGEQSVAGAAAASPGAPDGAAAPQSEVEQLPKGLCYGRILPFPFPAAAATLASTQFTWGLQLLTLHIII